MPERAPSADWLRLREIIRERSFRTDGVYTLSSGEKSGYYFDMKPTTFSTEGLRLICAMMYDLIPTRPGLYVGGLTIGADPIVAGLVFHSATRVPISGFCVREETKKHGTQRLIEGLIKDGAEVIIVDDVTTKGESVMKAVGAVRERQCRVLKVITVVDRIEGAAETFRREGLDFVPLYTTRDFV
jgi:orotate phosphoribosyltransferase